MSDDFLTDPFEDEKPLTGDELRDIRVLAGLSRSELEKCADLSPGRVRAIENGYLRLHRWESAKVKRLLFEEMAARAREIAKHFPAGGPAGGPALTENRGSSP
jgi:transcriptional regulator with XRE-family HTH domain